MATASGTASGLRALLAAGETFGRSDAGAGTRVQVEFVSAYPTGPLTILHGRGAAVGDAVANLLAWSGYRVEREFYVNDTGEQIEGLAQAVEARYQALAGRPAAPNDAYPAESVEPPAAAIFGREGARLADLPTAERRARIAQQLCDDILREQRETLDRFGVTFDRWYSERELHRGAIAETVERLRRSGQVYDEEGALWLRSSSLGDEQDRPLVRSNGLPTYIAADIAYHLDKQRRGFGRVVDVWGPDHSDYVARTRAGLKALGIDAGWLEVVILGPVTLKVDGLRVEGLNRKTHAVMLDELIDELRAPVARLSYLERPAAAPLEIDLDCARQQAPGNPVYRIFSAWERVRQAEPAPPGSNDAPLTEAQQQLARQLARFPDEVRAATAGLDPHRIFTYTLEVASRVEAAIEAPQNQRGSAAAPPSAPLAGAARIVLENALSILGVSAPEPN